MIILDTNVISEAAKPVPNERVIAWLNRQRVEDLFLTAISVAELKQGIATLPEGKRKEWLRSDVDDGIKAFVTPILAFDIDAANTFPELVVRAKRNRYTLPTADAYIGAIASSHGYIVATRDTEPFVAAGVAVVNPWED